MNKSALELRESMDYERGYHDGYIEGYHKGLEEYIRLMKLKPSPQYIVVTEEQMERIKKKEV